MCCTDEFKYTYVFWVRSPDQLKKYGHVCIRNLKQYAIACVRGTGQLKLCVLVEYVLWIFASNSVYVEVNFHDCAALMMKDHPHRGHSFIAYQSPVSTDQQLNTLQGVSFLLLGCIDSLQRSIAQARRAVSHIPLCCGIWFMSSAWSFALATQTPLAVRFCTHSSCDFVHEIARIVAHWLFLVYALSAIHYCLEYTHTASQQAHGKLKIDSVRFYTHKFLQIVFNPIGYAEPALWIGMHSNIGWITRRLVQSPCLSFRLCFCGGRR